MGLPTLKKPEKTNGTAKYIIFKEKKFLEWYPRDPRVSVCAEKHYDGQEKLKNYILRRSQTNLL